MTNANKLPQRVALHYRTYGMEHLVTGDGPVAAAKTPLVLLHGLMGYASNWGKVYPGFAATRTVLVLDQRGHGKSDKPPTGYAPSDYAGDLAHLMDELGWPRAHIMGHSMGGRVAMYFAAHYPARTRTLILEDSGAEGRANRLEWLQSLFTRAGAPFATKAAAQAYFARDYATDPLVGAFLHSNIEQKEHGTYDWRFRPEAMEETIRLGRVTDAMKMFREIAAPTLIIRGGDSRELKQDEAERMEVARANVELAVVPAAGHYIHSTHAPEFLALVNRFLNKYDD